MYGKRTPSTRVHDSPGPCPSLGGLLLGFRVWGLGLTEFFFVERLFPSTEIESGLQGLGLMALDVHRASKAYGVFAL